MRSNKPQLIARAQAELSQRSAQWVPDAPPGTCIALGGGYYRVRAQGRWWILNSSPWQCACYAYRNSDQKDAPECSHLPHLRRFLSVQDLPAEDNAIYRDCYRCGTPVDVTGVRPKSREYSYCPECRLAYGRAQWDVNKKRGVRRSWEHLHTPKAIVSARAVDICWAAGFLEGEATFGQPPPPRHRNKFTQSISVYQVNPEPLLRLQSLFGGAIKDCPDRQPQWSRQCLWSCSGARARGVMFTLFQFFSTRRQEQVLRSLGWLEKADAGD